MARLAIAAVLGTMAAAPGAAEGPRADVYFSGEGAVALIAGGTVRAAGRHFACAGCHGADGQGSREGAVQIPPVTWQALTRATGRRPAYDAAGFARAIRDGLRSDGAPLSSAMPRYEIPEADLASLIALLGRIEAEDRAAFGARSLRVAMPKGDPRRRGFADAAHAFNASRGAFGRVIEVTESGADVLRFEEIGERGRKGAAAAAEEMLFARLWADGHRRIRWLTDLAPAERDFRLSQRGFSHDETSRILLWTGRAGSAPHPEAAGAVYADLLVAAPDLSALIAAAVPVHLAAPGAEILGAARDDRDPLAYVEGYVAGLALGGALMEAGRGVGEAALLRLTERDGAALPLTVELIGDAALPVGAQPGHMALP